MGLCFETTQWLDRLWAEHLEISEPARNLVNEGIKKQGDAFAGFPDDLHARLYLPKDPPALNEGPEWATRLHTLATELAEWQRLRVMCSRNGFAAGIAAEAMLKELLPHVPERGEAEASGQSHGNTPQGQNEPGSGQPSVGGSQGTNPAQASPQPLPGSSDADLRAALRRASRTARDAVQEAEASLEGIAGPLGFSMSGTSVVQNAGPADLKAIREAHALLSTFARLKKIAELAGRMERVATGKARSKVKPGVGEVHGIDLGDDLARLLPSELVLLKRPKLKTLLMARLLEHRAMTYSMLGREPQARGPIVVLLDESGSMREDGKDIWSKAVCLALLATATRQKRAWHLVAFNGAIVREAAIPAGKATIVDIEAALDHGCAGGTNFNRPVCRAIDVIKTAATMRQADVVVITDGEADLEEQTTNAARTLTSSEGVSWFVVGVGPTAEGACALSLGQIATLMFRIGNLEDPELVAPVVGLDRSIGTCG